MPENRFYELIARKLSGEATAAELEELNAYLSRHGEEQYLFDILSTYWSKHSGFIEEENNEDERFRHILISAQPADETVISVASSPEAVLITPHSSRTKKWISYAAASVLLVTATLFFLFQQNSRKSPVRAVTVQPQQAMKEIAAGAGSKSMIYLPDGTKVWLNGESKLTYVTNFSAQQREVNLEGEAFFDVTHDSKRPFIVHTSRLDIKVLGTTFNVKSYESENTIEATLLKGSIEVFRKNEAGPKFILKAHQKLVFDKKFNTTQTDGKNESKTISADTRPEAAGFSFSVLPKNKPDSVIKEISWTYNRLVIDGDNFEELAAKLERWYDVTIVIEDEELKHRRTSYIIDVETITQALDALKLTAPFDYTMKNKEVRIFKK